MTTSVTRPCFTTQHQTCKTKTKTDFLVSDRSCPKTDGLRPHHYAPPQTRQRTGASTFVVHVFVPYHTCFSLTKRKSYCRPTIYGPWQPGLRRTCSSPSSQETRSSADADNGLDAFSGQSRSTNISILGPLRLFAKHVIGTYR